MRDRMTVYGVGPGDALVAVSRLLTDGVAKAHQVKSVSACDPSNPVATFEDLCIQHGVGVEFEHAEFDRWRDSLDSTDVEAGYIVVLPASLACAFAASVEGSEVGQLTSQPGVRAI